MAGLDLSKHGAYGAVNSKLYSQRPETERVTPRALTQVLGSEPTKDLLDEIQGAALSPRGLDAVNDVLVRAGTSLEGVLQVEAAINAAELVASQASDAAGSVEPSGTSH